MHLQRHIKAFHHHALWSRFRLLVTAQVLGQEDFGMDREPGGGP